MKAPLSNLSGVVCRKPLITSIKKPFYGHVIASVYHSVYLPKKISWYRVRIVTETFSNLTRKEQSPREVNNTLVLLLILLGLFNCTALLEQAHAKLHFETRSSRIQQYHSLIKPPSWHGGGRGGWGLGDIIRRPVLHYIGILL